MITFYFSGSPKGGHDFRKGFDDLRSVPCSSKLVRQCANISIVVPVYVVATFDDSCAPWRLVEDMPDHWYTRNLCGRIYRKMHSGWPQFFIGLDENIWDSDSIGPRGEEFAEPVLFGPNNDSEAHRRKREHS